MDDGGSGTSSSETFFDLGDLVMAEAKIWTAVQKAFGVLND
ncbi:hypothetical protein BF49_4646 [Bradyrhizobium sp.]|nr:hypothetical protein [Bradyrhizobium sp.]CUT13566.1 hypothetical protein BF49_4646 [Bradyrhizobium sp.]